MNANFWERLKSFIEKVEVNDQQEEKQIFLAICEAWVKFEVLTQSPKPDSTALIGDVKAHFAALKHKGWDWSSFYNGWIEGRANMAYGHSAKVEPENEKNV